MNPDLYVDCYGEPVKPGDTVKYWSPSHKSWRNATVVQFLWNTKGHSIKLRIDYSTSVVLKGDYMSKIRLSEKGKP